jgi:hopanoid biosynthesis associated radical SAM protein HpnH
MQAVDECPAPMVSLPGGEPLMHPEIDRIVAGLVARKKYIYLCTNALLLEEKLERFTPSKYLSFSCLDGRKPSTTTRSAAPAPMRRPAIREAVARGFRVTTNSTLFDGASPLRMREFFDEMMTLGVEGMMISPGYSYSKAPDQEHFSPATHELFTGAPLPERAVQPVAALQVPGRHARARLHAVGMPAAASSAGRSPATCSGRLR